MLCLLFGLFVMSDICLGADLAVTWEAHSTAGAINIDGKDGSAHCVLDTAGLGTCESQLGAFHTGIAKRDEHMRDKYLEVAKYPKATLKLTTAANGVFGGDLTLKGVTKPVNGKYTLSKDGLLEAVFTISLDDYGVGVPSFMGVTVAKDVTVKVAGSVK